MSATSQENLRRRLRRIHFGHVDDVEGTGALSGINVGDIDLNDSGVYGAKVGYFMPRRVNWLGVEMEAFNTTPHLKQTALTQVPTSV